MNFRTTVFAGLAGALMLGVLPVAAAAQPSEVKIRSDEDWEHQWTAMVFPAEIGNFVRTKITQFEERDGNIGASYFDKRTGSILSLYIYRPGNPDPSIWHDRAISALLDPEGLGPFENEGRITRFFVPPGGSAASGVSSVFSGSGDFKSTGVALYRAGDWLIKVRLSSRGLKPGNLAITLDEVTGSLPAMEQIWTKPAYMVPDCADSISFTTADRLNAEGEDAQSVAIMTSIVGLPTDFSQADTVAQYCHQGSRRSRYGIYRPDSSKTQYVIGFGDSGFSINVAPSSVLAELLSPGGNKDDLYLVTTANELGTRIFTPFLGMPSFDQAAKAAFEERAIASISRPFGDEGTTVNISAPAGGAATE